MLYVKIVLREMYWLMEGEQRIVRVIAVSANQDTELIKIRLPNGALQEVHPDELEKA